MALASLGQILDTSWETYSKHLGVFLKITAWFFIASAVFAIGTILAPAVNAHFLVQQGLLAWWQSVGIALTAISGIVLFLVSVWVGINLIHATNAVRQGAVNLAQIRAMSWKRAALFFVLVIIRSALVVAPTLAIVPGFALMWAAVNWNAGSFLNILGILLFFVGIVVALVGVVIMGVKLSFANFVFVLENASITQALKKSIALVKGQFIGVFVRLVVPKIIYSVIWFVVSIILFILLNMLFMALQNISPSVFADLADISSNLVTTLLTAIFVPLFLVTDYYIYKTLIR